MTTRQDAMDRAGETGEVVFGCAPVAVATSDAEHDENWWYDLAARHATRDWNAEGYLDSVKALVKDAIASSALPVDFKQATDQGGWISVADRLPEHEQTVLCHGAASREPWTSIACFHRDGSFYDPEIGDEIYPPTHWQPLPAAPALLGVADGDAVGGKSGGAA